MAIENPTPVTPLPTAVPQRGVRSTFSDLVDGFVTWFTMTAIPQMAALVQNVYNNALEAFSSAQKAEGARLLAQSIAQGIVATPSAAGTSTTSLQLGYGSKTVTMVQTNRTFSLGQWVVFADANDPRNTMSGPVTAFTQGTGVITIDARNVTNAAAGVFPTITSWIVALSGTGAQTAQQQALTFTPVQMAANDMDLTQGEWFKKTINGNTAFTWSNVPPAPYGRVWVLDLTLTSGMVSFPSAIRWVGGLTPTLLTNRRHKIVFSTTDGGVTVDAAALASYATS